MQTGVDNLAAVEMGLKRIDDEALHVVGETLELGQIVLGRGREPRATAVPAAGLRLNQLFAQPGLHLVDLLPGSAIGDLELLGRGADRAGGGDGAQQFRPPEGEDDLAVDFEPEVVAGLQSQTSLFFLSRQSFS